MWKDLVNTPRKAACWAVIVIDLILVTALKLSHASMTDVQLLMEFWPVYALIIGSALVAYHLYPKH